MLKRLQTYAPHIYFFFFYAAAASFGPFLGYWFQGAGLSSQQIGVLYAIGPFAALFVQPLWGALCDRFGMEKSALLICSLFTPLIAFGYSFAGSFAMFALTALLLALFSSPMAPLADAIAVNHTNRHGQTYGGARVWGSIGWALVVFPMGILYQRIGIRHMFSFYMALMAVVFAAAFLLERGGGRQNVAWRDIGRLVKKKQFAAFLPLVFLVAFGAQSYGVFFSVFLGHLGGSVSLHIGILTAVSATSELPFFIFAKRIVERFGYRRVMAACAIVGAVRFLVVSFYPPFAILMACQLLQGANALFYAAGVQFAYDISPERLKTTGQSLYSMVYVNLAVLIASNVGGWLIDSYGYGLMYRVAAAISVLGGIGFFMYNVIVRALDRERFAAAFKDI